MLKFWEVFSNRPVLYPRSRYIHKYYLPQDLRVRISPVDIDGINICFYRDSKCEVRLGHISEDVPDCVIRYKDLGLEKRVDGDMVRRVLLVITTYLADDRAELTPEEDRAAMKLNAWFIEWEKDLLTRCIQVIRDLEQEVCSGNKWLSDYEIGVKVEIYGRDDDPLSEDAVSDESAGDIDSDTGLLCSMELQVNNWKNEDYWGIGDDRDHNDIPVVSRKKGIFNVRHCAIFHELFNQMPIKHAGRVGRISSEIIVRHQSEMTIDLK